MRTPRSLAAAVLLAGLATAAPAVAQQRTFHLDRLEMPGAPDDGDTLFRPVTQGDRTIFFGQLGLGYSHHPLKTRNVISDPSTLRRSQNAVVSYQFTQYMTAGLQLLDRVTVAASLPVTWGQDGQNPSYATGFLGSAPTTTVTTGGPAAGDARLDFRGVITRSDDRRAAFGAQLSVFVPSGTTTNFGGDGSATTMLMVNGEWSWRFFTFVANTGLHFRPTNSINTPSINQGLGIGNEWRWAVGVFVPIKDGRFRVGGSIFGQTGIESGPITGDTFFRPANTPLEWHAEGRMKFGPRDAWWAGVGGGTMISPGYGAPNFRLTALIGAMVPILESTPVSPQKEYRVKWQKERRTDSDNDGIPDDIDACPTEPEDKLGSDPNDGCPVPPDRDGDGIPDQYDQCPDKPEDKDGIEDGDGCPEDDFDQDGVADAQDACPRAPGKPSTDPKQNGCPTGYTFDQETGVIKFKQQVHFKTGSAEILPDSFPMLQEVADFLRANPSIKRVSVEGHTDNRGGADLNLRLSQARAESVMNWLVQHGTDAGRLEAHGYGLAKPIESNATEQGRAANRRVEFKIVEEADMNKTRGPASKAAPPPAAPEPTEASPPPQPAPPAPAPKAPAPAPKPPTPPKAPAPPAPTQEHIELD